MLMSSTWWSVILLICITFHINVNALDIWYYPMTGGTKHNDWITELGSYSAITSNSVCPVSMTDCWRLAKDSRITRTASTIGMESIQLEYMMNSQWINGQKQCIIDYTINGVNMYTIAMNSVDQDTTYNSWVVSVDNQPELKIRLRSVKTEECYYAQFRLVGIASPTSAPTTSPSNNPTSFPTQPPTTSPTAAPTIAPTNPPTTSPTAAPTNPPTNAPSSPPTSSPSNVPSQPPSSAPTQSPSDSPSRSPSIAPTNAPTKSPSDAPSRSPSIAPTNAPTESPSMAPTNNPTLAPSNVPSTAPTNAPSLAPTVAPSLAPTDSPTDAPSAAPSLAPTQSPSNIPTQPPTAAPSDAPSSAPTNPPTASPSASPTQPPTNAPSDSPTKCPSMSPTKAPTPSTLNPTNSPTVPPTNNPTSSPSDSPTSSPTQSTFSPSIAPTNAPTESPSTSPTEAPSTPTLNPTNSPTAYTLSPSISPTEPTSEPSRSPTTSYSFSINIVFEYSLYNISVLSFKNLLENITDVIAADMTEEYEHCVSWMDWSVTLSEYDDVAMINGTVFVCDKSTSRALIKQFRDYLVEKLSEIMENEELFAVDTDSIRANVHDNNAKNKGNDINVWALWLVIGIVANVCLILIIATIAVYWWKYKKKKKGKQVEIKMVSSKKRTLSTSAVIASPPPMIQLQETDNAPVVIKCKQKLIASAVTKQPNFILNKSEQPKEDNVLVNIVMDVHKSEVEEVEVWKDESSTTTDSEDLYVNDGHNETTGDTQK